eukprot:3903909-Pyramimonas_sp.AAC.1
MEYALQVAPFEISVSRQLHSRGGPLGLRWRLHLVGLYLIADGLRGQVKYLRSIRFAAPSERLALAVEPISWPAQML